MGPGLHTVGGSVLNSALGVACSNSLRPSPTILVLGVWSFCPQVFEFQAFSDFRGLAVMSPGQSKVSNYFKILRYLEILKYISSFALNLEIYWNTSRFAQNLKIHGSLDIVFQNWTPNLGISCNLERIFQDVYGILKYIEIFQDVHNIFRYFKLFWHIF